MNKRDFLFCGALFSSALMPSLVHAVEPFNFARARTTYLERIDSIKRAGILPIIDIESSYNPLEIDLQAFTRSMDRAGIALMCLSVDQPGRLVGQGQSWSDHALESYWRYPGHFIPTGNGGNHPAWTRSPERFLADQERFIVEHRYPLMGEIEVRHYLSPRQAQRGESYRDVDVAIDGVAMERIFAFAQKTGIPFQIHYEVEDRLLDPLERMLAKYPGAKVIWCHLAQIRYQQRSNRYGPDMIAQWLDKYPNLFIDTALAGPLSVYPISGERHSRYWNDVKRWTELIESRPYRFLAALDIGGDRLEKVEEWTGELRRFLATVSAPAREVVAYKAAWKLIFNEEI